MAPILIVDDDPDVGRLMTTLLKHMGYNGAAVASGEEGLKFVRDALPSLIILDIMMPGMNGFEMLTRLKSEAHSQPVPVVMFSAATDPQYRSKALADGAVEYWVKASLGFEELRKSLARLVGPAGAAPSTSA